MADFLDGSRVEILQEQKRERGMGGTDSPAVLGMSPWSTPLQVYRDKVGERRGDFSTNRMKLGNVLEPFVLETMCEQLGVTMTHGQTYVRDRKKAWLLGSLDGIAYDPELEIPCLLEAKTSSSSPWETVPPHYWLQVQHYLGVTGLRRAYVGALFLEGDYPLVVYPIDASDEAWAMIVEADDKFWLDHVVAKKPPLPTSHFGDKKALEDLWPTHVTGAVSDLPVDFIKFGQRIEELTSTIKEAEDEKAALENLIRMEIGEAEFGRLPDGSGWSYRTTQRGEYTVKATSYRQLRRTKVENIAKAMKAMKAAKKAD